MKSSRSTVLFLSIVLAVSCEVKLEEVKGYLDVGTSFEGCMFEAGVSDGKPTYKVDYIEEIKNS